MTDLAAETPFSYVTHTFPQAELARFTQEPSRLDLTMRGAVFVPDLGAGIESRQPGIFRNGFLSGQGVIFYRNHGGQVFDATFQAEFPSKLTRTLAKLSGIYLSPPDRTPLRFKQESEI